MNRCSRDPVPMGVLGQTVDVGSELFPVVIETEPVGNHDIPFPRQTGHLKFNGLFSSLGDHFYHLAVGKSVLLGISGVAVAGIYGVLYVRLHRVIRTGDYGLFFQRMPSLEDLGDLNASASAIGFFSLTVTVGIGAWGAMTGRAAANEVALPLFPIATTIALWLLLGVCAVGHRIGKLGGVRLAWCTVVALSGALGLLIAVGSQGVHG